MKFVSGLMVGSILVAIPCVYFVIKTQEMKVIFRGPGVLKICDELLDTVDCQTQMIGEIAIPNTRYGLWIRE